jgi:hypothetical protein
MRVLALDASTKTGWALFDDGRLLQSGALKPVKIRNFNVNDKNAQKSDDYPYNIVDAAAEEVSLIHDLIQQKWPLDIVVVENTNKGKNRHTQRVLEFIHHEMLLDFRDYSLVKMKYMDTSEWRSIVGLWMSKDDLKNNKEVRAGKKRGKISKKHLAVRMVNDRFGKALKLKDNDEADAILMGLAYVKSHAAG